MFSNSIKLTRLFGIDVELDFSWLIIFMVFSFSLATGYFPGIIPEMEDWVYWLMGIFTTVLLFTSVLIHEFAHSLMAIREGHDIKKITLFIFGGVAQLDEEPKTSPAEFKITIVGPLSSIVVALLFWLIYLIFPFELPITQIWAFLANINLTISLVNMVPAFPLDGGRILRAIIWYYKKDQLLATKISVIAGSIFAFLLIGFGFLITVTVSVMGLWYIFLGWLLYQAGQSSYSQVSLKNTLSGYRVKDVMSREVVVVSTEQTVEELIDEFYKYKVSAFPVVGGSYLAGLVTMNQVKTVDRAKFGQTKVRDIITPLSECIVMEPENEAVDAMMKMAQHNAGRVLVMRDGYLVGILSHTDMMRLVKMKTLFGR